MHDYGLFRFASKQELFDKAIRYWNPDKTKFWLKAGIDLVIDRREGYRYLYPQGARGKKLRKHGSHGQEQTYFLCHLKPGAPQVNVDQKPREFRAYRWIPPEEFDLDWLPEFKRDVYREVMRDFFRIAL